LKGVFGITESTAINYVYAAHPGRQWSSPGPLVQPAPGHLPRRGHGDAGQLRDTFNPLGVHSTRLRRDRILDEARHTAAPVHLVRVFGITDDTAMRYGYTAHPGRQSVIPIIRGGRGHRQEGTMTARGLAAALPACADGIRPGRGRHRPTRRQRHVPAPKRLHPPLEIAGPGLFGH
jgi:hypothetical protein